MKRMRKALVVLIAITMLMSGIPMGVIDSHAETVTLPTRLIVGETTVIEDSTVQTVSGEGWTYDTDTNTLSLTNAAIDRNSQISYDSNLRSAGIFCLGDLNLVVTGESNDIQTTHGNSGGKQLYGIYVDGSLNISGDGSLYAHADNVTDSNGGSRAVGIRALGGIKISDSVEVKVFAGKAQGSNSSTGISGGVTISDTATLEAICENTAVSGALSIESDGYSWKTAEGDEYTKSGSGTVSGYSTYLKIEGHDFTQSATCTCGAVNEYTGYTSLDEVELDFAGASDKISENLPGDITVDASYSDKKATIEWTTLPTIDKADLDGQIITAKGVIKLPVNVADDESVSKEITRDFKIGAAPKAEKPTATVTSGMEANGKYSTDITVSLASATEDADIYYTTDGNAPTTSSTKYTGNFELKGVENQEKTYNVKAIAVKEEMNVSDIAAASYVIAIPKEAPTAKITVEGLTPWQSFVNDITFGLFYKDVDKIVTIEADDSYSGIESVDYLISDTIYKTEDELKSAIQENVVSWTRGVYSEKDKALTDSITLKKQSKSVVYAKATDGVDNETIVSSNGVVLYTDSKAGGTTSYTYIQSINMDVIEFPMLLNGNSVNQVKVGNITLSEGADYEVIENADGSAKIKFNSTFLDDPNNAGEKDLEISLKPQGVDSGTETLTPVTGELTIIATKPNDDGSRTTDIDHDGNYGEDDDKTYIPDQDGDGKPEVDDNGDGVYEGTNSDNTYIPDQDGDGKPEVDDNGDGIYEGTAGDGQYIPVDTDEDGKTDEIVQVTDDNGDGIYEGNDGNRYIPDQDGDGFAEPDTDGDGVFDGTKKDGDGKNKEYIPADTDADGDVDEFIEVKPNEDGVYEDDANDDGVFGGEGDNAYVPIDDDADGDVDRYIPKDEFDKDKDKYVPVDQDGDGDIDHYVPKEAFEEKKDDYTPIDKDNDGDIDHYIPDETFDKNKDDYVGRDTDEDGNNEHYVPKDAVPADGHTHVAERAATCTDKALCEICDEFYGEPLGHDWGAWESISGTVHQSKCINDPEHVKTGEHSPELCCGDKSKQCTECGATGENDHTFTDKWQSNNRADTHWHGCENCGEKQPGSEGYHDYPNKNVSKDVPQICSICNYGGHITEVHPEDFNDDDIPEALRGKYKTVSDIDNAMGKVARESNQRVDGTLLFDAVLKYSADGGLNWYKASEEHFPKKADGTYDKLPVKIEVPKETSIDTHNYRVIHMFSQTSEKFGTVAGETEMPDVIEEKGDDGKEYLSFYVTGLSPIMVAWEEEAAPLNTARSTGDIPINEEGDLPIDEDGNIPIDGNGDGEIDGYITEDEFNKNKDKYVPIDKDGDGEIDYYVPTDAFDKNKYVPIDKDGDGKIDHYVSKDKFDKSKYAPIDKDGDNKADYYIPNGILTDPDGDGIYTPDGKKGPKYEGVDLGGDGIIDIYVLLTEGDGVDSGDDSDMILWLMLLMISMTAAGIIVVNGRRIRG